MAKEHNKPSPAQYGAKHTTANAAPKNHMSAGMFRALYVAMPAGHIQAIEKFPSPTTLLDQRQAPPNDVISLRLQSWNNLPDDAKRS
jgi:hypothetical protein